MLTFSVNSSVFFVLLYAIYLCESHDGSITIESRLGSITGNIKSIKNEKVYEFLGIQFGVTPIGSLRFRPSILNESWNTNYNATTLCKMCIQPNQNDIDISENCLCLNILTPNIDKNAKTLPVMIWIHGGGMKKGSGNNNVYYGPKFVDIGEDFVLVTMNYRLGPLGFLASEQLYNEDPINYPSTGGLNGIYDQAQAINWVYKYIDEFGGDPKQITIFGESAGGTSTCLLAISPIINIINPEIVINSGIMESAACMGLWEPLNASLAIPVNDAILEQHNMSTNITVLRTYPATDFKFQEWHYSVDGVVLSDSSNNLYMNLTANPLNYKNLIIGFNSMDGTGNKPHPETPQQYTQYLDYFIKNETLVNEVETIYYPLSDFPSYDGVSSAHIAWQSINGDVCLSCPGMMQMRVIMDQLTSSQFNGYIYEFRGGGPPYYAKHGSEVPFVFDHGSDSSVPWNQNLSYSMLSAWTNYGKYGIPNITNSFDQFNMEWKPFRSNNNAIIFDDNVRIKDNYFVTFRNGACPFWYNVVGSNTMSSICYDHNTTANPLKLNSALK